MNRLTLIFIFCCCLVNEGQSQNEVEKSSKFQVIIFLSPDCPVCQKYISRFNEISKDFSDTFTFTAIIPGKSKNREIRKFIREYEINFNVRSDKDNFYVKKLQPIVTPEVYVFDETKKIKYQGAIDNWFYELGKYRPKPTEHYLINALQSIRAGKNPDIERTEAIGCIIQADLKQTEEVKPSHMHH